MNQITLGIDETSDDFRRILNELIGFSLISHDRLYFLYQFAKMAPEGGDFAELGVYKGGSARLLSYLTDNRVYLFDTFDGMPDTDIVDKHQKGDFNDTSLESVKAYLSDRNNVTLMPGFFPETTKGIDTKFSFVHIDADIYQSTKDALEYFYPRLLPGGILMFDDYYWPLCPGVNLAIEEFLIEHQAEHVINLTNGQALLIKRN